MYIYCSIIFNEIEFRIFSLIKIFKASANNVAIINIIITFNYIYCGLIKKLKN